MSLKRILTTFAIEQHPIWITSKKEKCGENKQKPFTLRHEGARDFWRPLIGIQNKK